LCLIGNLIDWPLVVNDPGKDTYPGAAWQKADPGKLGWSVEKLDTAFAYAKSLGPGGLMVIDHGLAVVDWGATDYRSKIASVRKSLLSALYGIHVQTGKIDLNRTLAQLNIDDKPPDLTASEKQATIRMLLQARSGIYAPGDESIHPAYHFKMTVRDLARFGYLYLRKGKWQDKQIIPAAWIQESTTAYSGAGDNGGYGYLWWVAKDGRHFPGASVKDGSYSARGAGGKYIIVLPDRDLVIAYSTTVDYPDHATHMPAADVPKGIAAPEMGKLLNLILAAKPSE
jgi:CubicO group peptidase (beta-lactamase class C family)